MTNIKRNTMFNNFMAGTYTQGNSYEKINENICKGIS